LDSNETKLWLASTTFRS